MPSYTLDQVAVAIGARLAGDGALQVSGLAPLSDAEPGQIAFCANPRYRELARTSRATALIVSEAFAGDDGHALLRVADPYASYALAAALFQNEEPPAVGVHPSACVARGVTLGEDVAVGPYTVLGEGAWLGDGVRVGPGCYVGPGVRIGAGTRLGPWVVLFPGTRVGRRCILQSGSVIGSDGFGYATTHAGHRRIPQLGGVVIEDDVDLGANCTVDRGSLADTRIGRGSKLDNLVHVAHNVDVGEDVLIVAQVGISGSTRVGDRAVLAGQVGVVGHIEVGAGARVGAQSGVTKSVPAGEDWFGYPARERRRAFRQQALLAKLPELSARVHALEVRLAALEERP